MSETLPLIFLSYILYVIPFPIIRILKRIFNQKKFQWLKIDFLILLIPYIGWLITIFNMHGKSLSNLFVEPLLLGIVISLAYLVRWIFPNIFNSNKNIFLFILLLSLVAVIYGFLFPILPE